jgi:hypothetical protein
LEQGFAAVAEIEKDVGYQQQDCQEMRLKESCGHFAVIE